MTLLTPVPDGAQLFGMTSDLLDALFRKAKKRALIEDATFQLSLAQAIAKIEQIEFAVFDEGDDADAIT